MSETQLKSSRLLYLYQHSMIMRSCMYASSFPPPPFFHPSSPLLSLLPSLFPSLLPSSLLPSLKSSLKELEKEFQELRGDLDDVKREVEYFQERHKGEEEASGGAFLAVMESFASSAQNTLKDLEQFIQQMKKEVSTNQVQLTLVCKEN